MFYISQSVDIDRYCKNEVHNALQENGASIDLLNSHSHFLKGTRVLHGLHDLAFIPQFRNVPYLRRYTVNGRYLVTSFVNLFQWHSRDTTDRFGIVRDGLPEPPNVLLDHFWGNLHKDVSVDTLLLDGQTLVCLRVYGQNICFHRAGHYPILAGYRFVFYRRRVPLYVAVVRSGDIWYFTCVEEGACQVTYTDEVGDVQTTHDFFVLALRHNPSDTTPPYPCTRRGAMDPTGPIFWLRFWPERDPDYYEDSRLTDDLHLESFLDGLRDRVFQQDADSDFVNGFLAY